MINRFTSSGLAGARADILRADGIDARVAFRPRYERDGAPFCIDILHVAEPNVGGLSAGRSSKGHLTMRD
jgi:hypothetical protein